MGVFLRMKHWQLAFPFLFLPIVEFIYSIFRTLSRSSDGGTSIFSWIVSVLYLVVFGGWMFAMGTRLHSRLPAKVKMSIPRFKASLIVPYIYFLVLTIILVLQPGSDSDVLQDNPRLFGVVFIGHCCAILSLLYSMFVVSKQLKAVELRRPVTISDHIAEFFMLWFHPIGVWFIQPRINKIFANG